MTTPAIGIDFGTTNSSIARANPSGQIELAQFPYMGAVTASYRSLLYLEQIKERGVNALKSWSGPEGIEHYLAADHKGRLIQSLKSFLSNRNLQGTDIFNRKHTIEDLIARILRDLREKAAAQFGAPISTAVVGRPVRFVGAENDEDDRYAETRLRKAFTLAGYDSVHFEFEPIAAAHYYESTLDHDELILIGDFGGGTSDFSLLKVGPTIRRNGRNAKDLLGNAGVGVAGDSFDAKLIRHLVSPALGAGSDMHSMKRLLPIPAWIYGKLERWHHLSFLRAKDVMDLLARIKTDAVEPQKIAALLHLIKEDLGYQLHQSIQAVKYDLSNNPAATFRFHDGAVDLTIKVQRSSFERWISEDLHQIESCLDPLLKTTGVHPKSVDAVFLTGGSSFVPAVRKIFASRFGDHRIRTGNEFTSVAWGLALQASSVQIK
ncbi:MAG TPA: Hsp70 family protein [Candidatus Acidoferrum sp.]